LENLVRKEGPAPPEQALVWIDQVADALSYLHNQQPAVLHRDIKPANIRIRSDGRAMLVDFGLVKFYDPTMRTTMGARAITPGFSPPEQYGTGTTDTRTDIYALGATMYEILTGQEPPESVLRMSDAAVLLPADKINPNITPGISQVIDKAMALTPSQRYQSAVEFKSGLAAAPLTKKVGSKPVKKQPSKPATRPPAPTGEEARPRRQPWIWVLLLLLFIGIACVTSLWIFDPLGVFGRRDTPTPEMQAEVIATVTRRLSETTPGAATPRATQLPTRTMTTQPTQTPVHAGTLLLPTGAPTQTRTRTPTLTATRTSTSTPVPILPTSTPTRKKPTPRPATATPPPAPTSKPPTATPP
jgi:serine/threonine protein kinase